MSKLFGPDFITQKYLRRYPNSQRAKSWAGVMVHIQTENGVWREGGCGYTWPGHANAWVVPFEFAVQRIDHCGPEKEGRFLRASGEKVAVNKEREIIAKEARRYALHYPKSSDGRNTFLMFADYVERRKMGDAA